MSAQRAYSQLVICLVLIACGSAERSSGSRVGSSGLVTGRGPTLPGSPLAGAPAPGAIPAPGGPLLSNPTVPAAVSGSNSKVCASAVVQAAQTPPIVVFVVDGSGSMCAPYGAGGTRWQALRGALLEPSMGLIYRLQDQVKFGSLLYDGTVDLALALLGGVPGGPGGSAQNPQCALAAAMNKATGMCPQLLETPAVLNNAMAIDMAYPTVELGGSTPTDRAMKHIMDSLIPMVGLQGPDDKKPSEIFVILATDGAPNDICVGGVGGDGAAQRAGVIAEAQRGAAEGITTWVISLAGGDAALQAHLDEVARAGAPMNPAAHTFSPNSPDELVQTLAQLLGGAVGCNIALNGKVTVGQECLGTVQQNGAPLPCCQADATGAWKCSTQPPQRPTAGASPTPARSSWLATRALSSCSAPAISSAPSSPAKCSLRTDATARRGRERTPLRALRARADFRTRAAR